MKLFKNLKRGLSRSKPELSGGFEEIERPGDFKPDLGFDLPEIGSISPDRESASTGKGRDLDNTVAIPSVSKLAREIPEIIPDASNRAESIPLPVVSETDTTERLQAVLPVEDLLQDLPQIFDVPDLERAKPVAVPEEPAAESLEPIDAPVKPVFEQEEPVEVPEKPATAPEEPADVPIKPLPERVEPADVAAKIAPERVELADVPVVFEPVSVEPAVAPADPTPAQEEPADTTAKLVLEQAEPADAPAETVPDQAEPADAPADPALSQEALADIPAESMSAQEEPADISVQPAPTQFKPADAPAEPTPAQAVPERAAKRDRRASSKRKNSPDKDLQRLRRVDLLELLVDQIRENDQLTSENERLLDLSERLKAKLDQKDAQIEHLKQRLDMKDDQISRLEERNRSLAHASGLLDVAELVAIEEVAVDRYLKQLREQGEFSDADLQP